MEIFRFLLRLKTYYLYTIEALKRDFEAPEHSSEIIKWGIGLLPDGIIFFIIVILGNIQQKH